MDKYTVGQPADDIDSHIAWFEGQGTLHVERDRGGWLVRFEMGSFEPRMAFSAQASGTSLLQTLRRVASYSKDPLQSIRSIQKAEAQREDEEDI